MTATLVAPAPVAPAPVAPAPVAPVVPAPVAAETPAAAPVDLYVLPSRHADRVRDLARRAGLTHTPDRTRPAAVAVVVAENPEQALLGPTEPGALLLVCDSVSRAGLLRALRAGAVVLRAADLTPESLAAAVRRARYPHPSIPYPELSHLLTTPHPGEPRTGLGPATLTARQTSVLRLMADGNANADIARLLRCSEHTVKNVIYEIMARLQARNRAHAVAHAVRHGLV